MAKIIFFGNEQLAQGIKAKTPIFDALIEAGYEISALILPNGHTRNLSKLQKSPKSTKFRSISPKITLKSSK